MAIEMGPSLLNAPVAYTPVYGFRHAKVGLQVINWHLRLIDGLLIATKTWSEI